MNTTTTNRQAFWKVFVATVATLALAVGSLSLAVMVNVGDLAIDPLTGAMWAWAIGAGTVLWVFPRLKEALGYHEADG